MAKYNKKDLIIKSADKSFRNLRMRTISSIIFFNGMLVSFKNCKLNVLFSLVEFQHRNIFKFADTHNPICSCCILAPY